MTAFFDLAEALSRLAATAPITSLLISSALAALSGLITQLAFGDYT